MKVIDAKRVPKGAREMNRTFDYVALYDVDTGMWMCGTTDIDATSFGLTLKDAVYNLGCCLHLSAVMDEHEGKEPFSTRGPATANFSDPDSALEVTDPDTVREDEEERYTGSIDVSWWAFGRARSGGPRGHRQSRRRG